MRFVKLKKNLLMAAIALGLATIVYYPVQGKEPTTVSITKLNSAQISQQRKSVPDWALEDQSLQRTFIFKNFVEAVAFVNRLVEPAEKLGHHPDLVVGYGKVVVTLSTHDAGGLTLDDFILAQEIDRIAQ
jgi:4a-hydroxytetrahydrobiopterin dehydratase